MIRVKDGSGIPPGNDIDICARCAERYPTCCRIVPGMESSCFPISPKERARLEPHAQKMGIPLCIEEPNTQSFLQAMHKLFPGRRDQIRELFPPGHTHNRLPVDSGGSCFFLDRRGCVLPVRDRPYYCRLYPFWFINSMLFTFSSPECLAVNSSSSTTGLCTLFKTDSSSLRDLHDSLSTAWALHTDDPRPR